MLPRRISIILTICLLTVLIIYPNPIYAADDSIVEDRIETFVCAKIEKMKANISIDTIKTVYDFSGEAYKVVECSPKGYFIIHPTSGIILEYAVDSISPFRLVPEENAVYYGPTCYYQIHDGIIRHTVLGTPVNIDNIQLLIKECQERTKLLIKNANIPLVSYFAGRTDTYNLPDETRGSYWVYSCDWFANLNSGFGYQSGGVCGVKSRIVCKISSGIVP